MLIPDQASLAPRDSSTRVPSAGFPLRIQWLLLFAVAAAIAVAFGFEALGVHVLSDRKPAPGPQAAPTPGRFRPTQEQLASFKVRPVVAHVFRSERLTDGKIALNADRATPVYSPYSGRVTKVYAAAGDTVQAGDPLFAVEATEFVQGENDLVAAAAGLDTARSALRQAEINEQRKHALFDAKAGALQDWQQSQSDLAAARNAVRSAEALVASVRNRLRILGRASGDIDAILRGDRMRSTATVVAPISGTVTDRQVGQGQYIQNGAATPQFTVGDLTTVWLVANVREADAALVRRGASVEVRVMALPERVFRAKVSYVAPSVDPVTHRLPVRAVVDNADGALKPEMFASFRIATADAASAPAVPEAAVVYEGDTARVWVLAKDGSLALRQVRTGRSGDGMIEIVAGLEPGEQVATQGTLFIDRAAQGG
jgi:membrane fusion protein, heavy metal efflux system